MTLLTRISRLLRADVHHLLDQLEEPDVLLGQAIREMQDSLDQSHRTRISLDNERRQQEQRLAAIVQDQARVTEQLQLCLQTGNEALARTQMRRRLEQQKIAELLTARRDELSRTLAEIDLSLQQRVQVFEDLQQKAALLGGLTDRFDPLRQRHSAFAVTDDEVDMALLAEQQAGEVCMKHLLHPLGALLISLLAALVFPVLVALLGTTLALCAMVAGLSLLGPAIWLRQQRLRYTCLITALALSVAAATLTYTHSIFMAVWCFLLVIWVAQHLLASSRMVNNLHPAAPDSALQVQQMAFVQAQRTAETALGQMVRQPPPGTSTDPSDLGE